MLVTSLEYSDYVGKIAVGRVFAGKVSESETVTVIDRDGEHSQQKILQIHQFDGLGKRQVESVTAGNICAISGLDAIDIGDTITWSVQVNTDALNAFAAPGPLICRPILQFGHVNERKRCLVLIAALAGPCIIRCIE